MALKILTAAHVDSVIGSMDLQLAVASQAAVFGTFSASASSQADDAPGIAGIQLPQRHVLQSPAMSMLFMPGRINHRTAIKIVSVPTAGGDGLPGTTLVMDEETGHVRAVVNARKLTALRNAAGSVLSAQVLGERTPTSLLVFGSGAQADSHIRALAAAYPTLKSVTVIARKSTPRASALVESLSTSFPSLSITLGIASFSDGTSSSNFDLSAAVRAADIICTMTSSTAPLFAAEDVKPGVHVVLIGSYKPHMREVEDALLSRVGAVLVDSREACAHEAGELQNIDPAQLVELGELVNGDSEALDRAKSGEVTLFKSVGLGVQDVAIAGLVLDEAEKMGLGTEVPGYD